MVKFYIKKDIVFDIPQIHRLVIVKIEITIYIYFLYSYEIDCICFLLLLVFLCDFYRMIKNCPL
jgi:hypothetical protein